MRKAARLDRLSHFLLDNTFLLFPAGTTPAPDLGSGDADRPSAAVREAGGQPVEQHFIDHSRSSPVRATPRPTISD
jgi:hypothetical protein